MFALCSQFFDCLRETLYDHALEPLEAARPEKMGNFCFYGKCVTTIDLLKRL